MDYSSESLVFVWRWFIKTARIEKTPQEEVERMERAAVIFGESYVNRTQFTVATQYILRDVAMYLGQCYSELIWSPKSSKFTGLTTADDLGLTVGVGTCTDCAFLRRAMNT